MKNLIIFAAALTFVAPSTAHAAEKTPSSWWPELTLHAGLPFYFSFYGRAPDPEESTLAFAGHLGMDATWPVWSFVRAGLSVDGGYVSGDISGVDGYVYSIAIGPALIAETAPWTGEWFNLAVSFSPSVLAYGTVADENLQKHSTALGLVHELSVRVPVYEGFSVGAFGGLGLFGSPLSDGVWFNEPLGRTNAAYFSLGATFRP